MFRHARATEPAEDVRRLANILKPLPVYPWSNMAMHYLGVPIIVSLHFLVVQDQDYQTSVAKLVNAGLSIASPSRGLHPDILSTLPNAEEVMAHIMAGYSSLDRVATFLNYNNREEQVVLVPNSFACIPLSLGKKEFNIHSNIHYPLERCLLESFIRCALLEDKPGISDWGMSLTTSVWTMMRYLDIENDILDSCEDRRAVEWFSENFGRGHEKKYGRPDYRISKRIGSGRELSVNSRGRPVA